MLLPVALALLCASCVYALRYDVCIVGAGPAGVGAAVTLAAKTSRSVALFDNRPAVGGQSAEWFVDTQGVKSHMGAVWVVPQDYTTVTGWAATLNISLAPLSVLTEGAARVLLAPGVASPNVSGLFPALTGVVDAGFAPAFNRFIAITSTPRMVRALSAPFVYDTLKIAPELAVSMDFWMTYAHPELAALHPVVSGILQTMGYGHITAAPAASALRFITCTVLKLPLGMAGLNTSHLACRSGFPDVPHVFESDIGYSAFLARVLAAGAPNAAVYLGATVVSLVRPPAGDATLSWADARGGGGSAGCGAVVNTAGQTLAQLAFADLDAAESRVFAKVFANSYTTTAVSGPCLPAGLYSPGLAPLQAMGPLQAMLLGLSGLRDATRAPRQPSLGAPLRSPAASADDPAPLVCEPLIFLQLRPGAANAPRDFNPRGAASRCTLVTYALADGPVPNGTCERLAASSIGPHAVAEKSVTFTYWPRVTPADLRAGWARSLEALQGRRGTYHAGGLLTFWDVEQALRSGRDVVERYLV